jgi:hypothetical protein
LVNSTNCLLIIRFSGAGIAQSVHKVTGWLMEESSSDSWQGKRCFSSHPDWPCGPPTLLIQLIPENLSMVLQQLGYEAHPHVAPICHHVVYRENILSLLIKSILVLGSIKYCILWALSPGVYRAEVRNALLPVYF